MLLPAWRRTLPEGCTAMSRLSVPFTESAVLQISGSVMKMVNMPTMELYDMPGKENLHAGVASLHLLANS